MTEDSVFSLVYDLGKKPDVRSTLLRGNVGSIVETTAH